MPLALSEEFSRVSVTAFKRTVSGLLSSTYIGTAKQMDGIDAVNELMVHSQPNFLVNYKSIEAPSVVRTMQNTPLRGGNSSGLRLGRFM
jgi:hypothetical protein